MTQRFSLADVRQILAEEIGEEEAMKLDNGSRHSYDCRCNVCKEWWKLMGADPLTGRYGPFTAEEIGEDRK